MYRVKDWMTPAPAAVSPETSALEALRQLVDARCRHLPVMHEGSLAGIVALEDLRAALPLPADVQSSPVSARSPARLYLVGELMTYAPFTAGPDMSLEDAARALVARRVDCLPVVGPGGELAGLFSSGDALRALVALLSHEVGSEPPRSEPPGSDLDMLVHDLQAEAERIRHGRSRGDSGDARPAQGEVAEPPRTDLAGRRLRAIERALERQARGDLGLCASCGRKIPISRLRALPGTDRCVHCATIRCAEPPRQRPLGRRAAMRRRTTATSAEPGHITWSSALRVYTREGEGRFVRMSPFGKCDRCGDTEGVWAESGEARCATPDCDLVLSDVEQRVVVDIGGKTVAVPPESVKQVTPQPYD